LKQYKILDLAISARVPALIERIKAKQNLRIRDIEGNFSRSLQPVGSAELKLPVFELIVTASGDFIM